MNINLRKANAIQNSIQENIRSIQIETTLEVNEFQDPLKVIQQANESLFANDARRQKLLQAFYNIRALVATANAASGISTNLAKAAFVEKRILQLTDITKSKVITDLDVIAGKLEKIKTRKDESYGSRDTVITGIVTAEQLAQARAEIKNLTKQKQKIQDENLELNIKTEIPLTEDTVKTLTEEGIF